MDNAAVHKAVKRKFRVRKLIRVVPVTEISNVLNRAMHVIFQIIGVVHRFFKILMEKFFNLNKGI